MSSIQNKLLKAKARQLLKEYSDVIELLANEVISEVERQPVIGDNAFEYAKKAIRKEALKEGINLIRQRLSKYAEPE